MLHKGYGIKMHRQAQGISLNTIIIAIIALIVLIILILIFTGQMGGFGRSLQSCVEKGGTCSSDVDCQRVKNKDVCSCRKGVTIPNTDCSLNMACCLDIFKEETT